MNSPKFQCTHFNSNLRYVNWGKSTAFESVTCPYTGNSTMKYFGKKYLSKGSSHPCILGIQDVRNLEDERKQRGGAIWYLFGNKFETQVDHQALEYLSTRVLRTSSISGIGIDGIDGIDSINSGKQNINNAYLTMFFEFAERPAPNNLQCPLYHGKGM